MLSSSAFSYVVSREDHTVQQVEEAVVTDTVPPLNGAQPAATDIVVPVEEVVAQPVSPVVTEVVETPAVVDTIVSPVDSPSAAQVVAPDTVVSTEPAAPVDIQMVVETQNPTEMLGQATQESGFCQSQANELLAMQQACEHYGKLIRQTGLEGVTEEGAAFMHVGLQMIQKSLGTDLVISKESLEDINPRSSRTKVTISAESVKELASKAYDAFIEAIKKLIALIEKGWDHVQDFGINQEREIDDKLARLRKLKTGAASQEIVVKNPTMLFADGEEVFPDTKKLFGLAAFALTAYPKAMEAYYKDLGSFGRAVAKTAEEYELDAAEISENLHSIAKPLTKLTEAPGINDKFNGNFVIDIRGDGMSFGIRQGEGKEAPAEVELVVEAPVKIRKMLEDIKHINKLIIDYRPTNARVHAAATKMMKEVEDMNNKDVTNEMLKMVNDSAPRNREIVHFVCKVTRAYLAVIEQMISKHEGVKVKNNTESEFVD
ncbi:virion structural protein [Pseudomonas phage Phabio]|uniref:Virion structural protein n=2 Tax=root TaxID=1 RepID=A0A1Y0STH6_9CAUD|nr:internal head protein [Pseudomonas phage Phabio]ARV76772.1 virion structural protein [Pseudomonas phage Phabio]